ncbi:LAME_0H14862g1_1 [Lachancea meyersii CBS 8951]|uniref:LAME_0H14862g1_1 n=1 Tax=Lachancea meyersii CBS 8951 TaxID=1266667 RepID=A0A1G4KHH1_9SACH|nr:LAME_0H14862g1_1 [Lachancea meyersii CBS 8951]
MFRPTCGRAYSALSKRTNKVKVQLLKDFPQFQLYKGQVTSVSPSLMRNYLHWRNGARYILNNEDIDLSLQAQAVELAALRSKDVVRKEKQERTISETVTEEQTTKKESKEIKQPKLFDSGLTLKDVKIPGLEL